MAAKFPSGRLEDTFQDVIIKRFANIEDFKKFARSERGLCLNDHDINQIVEDNPTSVEAQKLKMLQKWRAIKGEEATDGSIRLLVESYHGNLPDGYSKDALTIVENMYLLYKNQPLGPRGFVFFGNHISEIGLPQPCAIKFIPYDKNTLREAEILTKLQENENVISIKHAGIYKSEPFDYIYIVMAFGWTRNLRNFLNETKKQDIPFDEVNAKNLAKQMFKGLHFIHGKNVIHRDLKPENLLVSDDNTVLKITDFGISKTITTGDAATQTTKDTGTEGYRAAETYEDDKITQASDIFSAGIILAELLSNGRHPYGDNPDLWKYNIKNDIELDLSHLLVSNTIPVTRLIETLLSRDPYLRLPAKEVLKDGALKMLDHQTLHKQEGTRPKIVMRRDDMQVGTPGPPTEENAYRMKTNMTELFQTALKSMRNVPELRNVLRRAGYATSAGDKIFIYMISSEKFEIFNAVNRQLKKVGETKKLSSNGPHINVVALQGYLYVFTLMSTFRLKYFDTEAEWTNVAHVTRAFNFDKNIKNY